MDGPRSRILRDGGVDDVDVCVELWVEACAARDGQVYAGVAERARAKFDGPLVFVVAETGGRIDAFALATAPGSGAPSDSEGAAVLGLLAVDPASQGRGLGREMLRLVSDRLADAGPASAVLHVLADNVRAIRLYESEGWVATGSMHEHTLLRRPFVTLERRFDVPRSAGPLV